MVQYNVKARDGGSCYDRLLVGETKQQLIFEQWEADWGIRNSSPWILIKLETHKLNKTFAFRTEVTHLEYLRQIKFIMIGPNETVCASIYPSRFRPPPPTFNRNNRLRKVSHEIPVPK